MSDYFSLVIGKLKAKKYRYVGKADGGFELWRKNSRHVTVPVECKSRHTANGVMKAAGFWHRFE